MVRVKNVVGSDRYRVPSGYSSWLDYWKKRTGGNPSFCGASSCFGTDLVGAHVRKVDSTDRDYYITPICRSCNQRTDEFDVCWELVPVPSNL